MAFVEMLAEAQRSEGYLGALKSGIKEAVHGEVVLHLAHTVISDALVVIIEVPPTSIKPISPQQDQHLYVRTGASNRKLPPDQWKSILQSDKSRLFGTFWDV